MEGAGLKVHQELDQGAASPADREGRQEGSLDGLLVWICISCFFLLVGMHVYELIAWMMG
jgi:hypothetical protein